MYKRNYHPLIVLLYVSGMLDTKQLSELPRTTKFNWNQFRHENYYGNDWAEKYINQFEDIKTVFASAFLFKSLRFLVETRKGYLAILQEFSYRELLSWIENIKTPPFVMKITAQTKDFPFSNSMSESTHRIYKTEFLHGKYSLNEKSHLKDLEKFIAYYNDHRYPTELYGLTPMEVIQGKIPDKHFFKEKIQDARKNRVAVNQEFNACGIPVGCTS